jgi:excisionase family DNA binding protein
MQLLSTEETARRLGVHPETVRRLLRSGGLRGVKIGHVHRIEEAEISAYVERLKADAAPANVLGEVSREEAKAKGFGFLKGRIQGSDAFLEAKHAEARAELERDEERRGARGVAA